MAHYQASSQLNNMDEGIKPFDSGVFTEGMQLKVAG